MRRAIVRRAARLSCHTRTSGFQLQILVLERPLLVALIWVKHCFLLHWLVISSFRWAYSSRSLRMAIGLFGGQQGVQKGVQGFHQRLLRCILVLFQASTLHVGEGLWTNSYRSDKCFGSIAARAT